MTIVSAAQMRAARAILDWKQEELAYASGLSPNTIRKIENGDLSPRFATRNTIRRTIEDLGFELLDDDGIKRRDDLVKTYKGANGSKDFMDNLIAELKEGGNALAITIHSPETQSWFFSEQNAFAFDMLNRPTITASVKCLLSEHIVLPFVRPSFEMRLTLRQNTAQLPWIISDSRYSIIAHADEVSPPYIVSFRIPRASRTFLGEFRQAWKDGQRIILPETPKRRERVRS